YQRCDIYTASNGTAAFEVHGIIRDKYNALGGPASPLGLPVTDEQSTGPRNGGFDSDPGRFNHFSGDGSIFYHEVTGPMALYGGIRNYWGSQGWEQGPLGFPTRDERVVGSGQWDCHFENGVVFWQDGRAVLAPAATLSVSEVGEGLGGLLEDALGTSPA